MSALDLKQKTQNGEQIRAGNCPCQAFFSLLYFFIVAGSVIISRLGAAMAFMSLLHFIVIIFTCRICCVYSECTLPPTSMGFSHIFERMVGGALGAMETSLTWRCVCHALKHLITCHISTHCTIEFATHAAVPPIPVVIGCYKGPRSGLRTSVDACVNAVKNIRIANHKCEQLILCSCLSRRPFLMAV